MIIAGDLHVVSPATLEGYLSTYQVPHVAPLNAKGAVDLVAWEPLV